MPMSRSFWNDFENLNEWGKPEIILSNDKWPWTMWNGAFWIHSYYEAIHYHTTIDHILSSTVLHLSINQSISQSVSQSVSQPVSQLIHSFSIIMHLSKSTRSHYTVSYNSASHWGVLTQVWGSAWPRVLPYCVLNVLVMIVLTLLDERYSKALKIRISAQGHTVCSFFLQSTREFHFTFFSLQKMCLILYAHFVAVFFLVHHARCCLFARVESQHISGTI